MAMLPGIAAAMRARGQSLTDERDKQRSAGTLESDNIVYDNSGPSYSMDFDPSSYGADTGYIGPGLPSSDGAISYEESDSQTNQTGPGLYDVGGYSSDYYGPSDYSKTPKTAEQILAGYTPQAADAKSPTQTGLRSATAASRPLAKTGATLLRGIDGLYSTNQIPTFTAPTFTAPVYNENRVSAIAQQRAAPGLRKLENKANQAIVSTQNLPGTVRKLTLRDALAGYGEGRGSIMANARNAAANEYQNEYGDQFKTAQINYQGQLQSQMANYQAALDLVWKKAYDEANTVGYNG
jgi:hypothetical protein